MQIKWQARMAIPENKAWGMEGCYKLSGGRSREIGALSRMSTSKSLLALSNNSYMVHWRGLTS